MKDALLTTCIATLIGLALFLMLWPLFGNGPPVGTRSACEAVHPGASCRLVWTEVAR